MIEWGINALNHGSSLAVFKNGKYIHGGVFANETIPTGQIKFCLDYSGAPDRIYWYENPWLKKARQLYAGQYKTAFKIDNLPKHNLKQWGIGYAPVTYTPHHASHAAAGYYTSPFNHCAIVVLDAIGEFECASIWEGKHGEIKKVWSKSYPHSLGLFYSAFTKLIGLTPVKDEHLLQQMSQQGDKWRYFNEVNSYINGVVDFNYNFHRGVLDWPYPIETLQDQCDIAAAVQDAFETQIGSVMLLAKELVNSDCLVYMGGCAMNSQANKKYVEPMFTYRWSLPNPGDPSSSLGAVLYHTKQRVWDVNWDSVKHIDIKV